MSKNHRGKGILDKYKRGRGVCPVCKRTGIKIIHERERDKQKIFVCKICNVVLSKQEAQLKKAESLKLTEAPKKEPETITVKATETTTTEEEG